MREAEKKLNKKEVVKKDKSDAQAKRENDKSIKRLKNKISKVEGEISKLEKDLVNLDIELAQDYDAVSKQEGFFDNYQAKKKKIKSLEDQWESLIEELDVLE